MLTLSVGLIAGCGFQPLHTAAPPGGSVTDELARVSIGVIEDRRGQMLRNNLIDRFNPSGAPAYKLAVTVSEGIGGELVARDSIATRRALTASARFTLSTLDGATVLSGSERARTRFDVVTGVENAFADVAAERGARRRAMRDLADKITRRVGFALGRRAQ